MAGRLACELAAYFRYSGIDAQLLSPVDKTHSVGAKDLNRYIHPMVNRCWDTSRVLSNGSEEFWDGDRLMVTRNNWTLGCVNGDTGTLRMAPPENEYACAALDFPDGRTAYFADETQMGILRHGYAITVHKSQGSEYDTVIMPITESMQPMLTRNLFYTAISRAKKRVVLVGSQKAVNQALSTATPKRNSGLVERVNSLWMQRFVA